LIDLAQKSIDGNYPEVKRDDTIQLVVRQNPEGIVPLTVSTRVVADMTYEQLKYAFDKWFNGPKA